MPRRRSSAKRARGALNTTKRDLSRPKHAEPSPVACKVEPDRDHTEAEEQLGVDADDGNFLEEGASLSQCLPWEVWVNVLAFLAQSDLIRYSLTCRLFHDIANIGMVWRERLSMECSRSLRRWGPDLVDPAQYGWKAVYRTYTRFNQAYLNVSCTLELNSKSWMKMEWRNVTGRSTFTVERGYHCLAIDEEDYVNTPDVVAIGKFGKSSDGVQLWRKRALLSTDSEGKAKKKDSSNASADQEWALWRAFPGHDFTVSCMKFMEGTSRLITGSWDKTIKVWERVMDASKSPTCVATLSGHVFEVECMARKQTYLVSGGQDKMVKLWDLNEGKLVHTFEGHNHVVRGVQIRRDGQLMVSCSQDSTIRVWDPRAGSNSVSVYQTASGKSWVAMNPEGERIYFAPLSWGEVNAIDVKTKRLLRFHTSSLRLEACAMPSHRLDPDYDFLLTESGVERIPLDPASNISYHMKLAYKPYGSGVHPFEGTHCLSWSNSQVVVGGNRKEVFLIDLSPKMPHAIEPEDAEMAKKQARDRLNALKGKHSPPKVDLPAAPPEEEVLRDIERIQRQIEQITKGRRRR